MPDVSLAQIVQNIFNVALKDEFFTRGSYVKSCFDCGAG